MAELVKNNNAGKELRDMEKVKILLESPDGSEQEIRTVNRFGHTYSGDWVIRHDEKKDGPMPDSLPDAAKLQAKQDSEQSERDAREAKRTKKAKARKKISKKKLSASADLDEIKAALQDVIDSLQD